ncbi:MAG: extracellular solute-binding protein [Pseudomonadota bacterium]
MKNWTRRESVALGVGAASALALGAGRARAEIPTADVASPNFPIESGAKLTVLRPSKFVLGDEVLWLENAKKFAEATGVEVDTDFESWTDLTPKAAVAASIGSGPDIICGWGHISHQYPDAVIPLDDLAGYLGAKYGGWWPMAEKYGQQGGKWISMPIGASGGRVVYRKSWVEEAGFDTVPTDTEGFLDLCRKLKANGHPPGLALGNAEGDGNAWTSWLVWSHGGAMVDEVDRVIINSPETVEALKYGKALYETFIQGTESWLDASNNKAFLAGQLGLTQNGISIYYAAKTSEDPAMQALAEDIFHARMPIGPVDITTERSLTVNAMVMKYTEYPNAAMAFLQFMMEAEQYDPWLNACIGYWNHPLQAYDASKVWTDDPKHDAYKHVLKDALWDGYSGSLGEASSAVLADFVMVEMVASVCTGRSTPEEAAAEAQRRAERYYGKA